MALTKTWPPGPEWLGSATRSSNFLDEWSAIHFFVTWKMAQVWGFWPAMAAHTFYELVVDPLRHAPEDRATPINTLGDSAVALIAAMLGVRHHARSN